MVDHGHVPAGDLRASGIYPRGPARRHADRRAISRGSVGASTCARVRASYSIREETPTSRHRLTLAHVAARLFILEGANGKSSSRFAGVPVALSVYRGPWIGSALQQSEQSTDR